MRAAPGLFGHIQRNNAKSVLLLVVFLLLLELMQIGFRLIPHIAAVHQQSRFGSIELTLSEAEAINLKVAAEPGQSPPEKVKFRKPTFTDKIVIGWHRFATRTSFFQRDWYLILIVGLGYLASACWWSSVIMRYETRAQPLGRKDAPDLYNLVENLAMTVGLPPPKIEIIESPQLNAYAAGFFPSSSSIVLTRGLVEKLNRPELEAVIAHELVHIRDRDVRLLVMARACVDMVLPMGRSFAKKVRVSPYWYAFFAFYFLVNIGVMVVMALGLLVALVSTLALALRFAISRTREFTADAGAIELTKNPAALISALRKVAGDDVLPLASFSARAMMFSCSLEGIFKTHPPLDERIEAIVQHTGLRPHELPVVRRQPISAPTSETEAPTFGRRRVVQGMPAGMAVPTPVAAAERPLPVAFPARRSSDAPTPVFGQRQAVHIDPTKPDTIAIPDAEVLAARPVTEQTGEESWGKRWIASGRIDRMAESAASAVFMPFRAMMQVTLISTAFAVVFMLLLLALVQPLVGVPLLGGVGYALYKLSKRARTLIRDGLHRLRLRISGM